MCCDGSTCAVMSTPHQVKVHCCRSNQQRLTKYLHDRVNWVFQGSLVFILSDFLFATLVDAVCLGTIHLIMHWPHPHFCEYSSSIKFPAPPGFLRPNPVTGALVTRRRIKWQKPASYLCVLPTCVFLIPGTITHQMILQKACTIIVHGHVWCTWS